MSLLTLSHLCSHHLLLSFASFFFLFFFFNHPPPTEIYTLSLHDALPICDRRRLVHQDEFRRAGVPRGSGMGRDRKSTRLNSSHLGISYAVFCLKKKKKKKEQNRLKKNKTHESGRKEHIYKQTTEQDERHA